MIVQILVGGVAPVGVSLKLFWWRILTDLDNPQARPARAREGRRDAVSVAAGGPAASTRAPSAPRQPRLSRGRGDPPRVSEEGAADGGPSRDSRLFERATADGELVATEEVDAATPPRCSPPPAVLRHERIPFLSYPTSGPSGCFGPPRCSTSSCSSCRPRCSAPSSRPPRSRCARTARSSPAATPSATRSRSTVSRSSAPGGHLAEERGTAGRCSLPHEAARHGPRARGGR